jgi:outer membrane protein TolC
MTNNKELTLSRINREVAELEIKEVRGERFPEIDLNAGYSYSRSESGAGFIELNQTDGFNYGITTRFNIFDGFNTNRRVENARIQLKNQQLILEDQKRGVEAGLLGAFKNYANSLDLVILESENLTFAEQSLEIALERFKLGTINSIELREVQRTLISAESRLIQAQFEAKLAETELQRISGRLTQ